MRKLLNTLYITNELAYICLDGENIVCKINDEVAFRIPFDNVEGIVCFSYLGCSPALMGKCVEKCIPINFISPHGRFLAKICGETKGNVFLRIAQIEKFNKSGLTLAKNTMASKFHNSIKFIKRSMHDIESLRTNNEINNTIELLKNGINNVFKATTVEEIVAIEGNCAKGYFSIFNKFILNKDVKFNTRTKRPPMDEINACLSFIYTLLTIEYAAALETVGLDSYIGFCHKLRSGRVSLACDLVEETRAIVDRFVLSCFNLKILSPNDFDIQISGAVILNADGRKKIISKWQEKKRTEILHPYLNQKIMFGLLPYVQANLLAKYVRGEISEYPCFLIK